jgi:hypothetical protein
MYSTTTAATLSSDGTSHKNIDYNAKHVVVCNPDESPRTYAIPLTILDDHTSKTQQQDWSRVIRLLFEAYEACFVDGFSTQTWRQFIRKIKGASTDHASDQKLLIQLLIAWKREVDRELRGEEMMKTKSALEVLQLISKELRQAYGKEAVVWEELPEDEQRRLVSEAWRSVCVPYGEEAYKALSVEEQAEIDSFVWAGCCMHKGMNATKAGYDVMGSAWASLTGAVPPVKMVKKDNRAALENAPEDERRRINGLSKGGAAKLTELLGALLRNKDDKKGQQNIYKIAFEKRFGQQHAFPETNQTRFGSHLQAAVELVLYLEWYQEFMGQVRDGKKRPAFTNMEQNIVSGLECLATLTELCVAALYNELVDRPYMQKVRSAEADGANLLDLAPLHNQVLAYTERVANNPDAILAALSSEADKDLPLTFTGLVPERPAVLRAVCARAVELPHLKAMLVAFFKGAHAKWVTFTEEFAEDSKLSKMTPDQRRAAFLHPTNDRNEGALGRLRVILRRCPNMTLRAYNCRMLIKYNDVVSWFRSKSPKQRTVIQQRAREAIREYSAHQERMRLAHVKAKRAEDNAARAQELARKHAARIARDNELLADMSIELDSAIILNMKGADLNLQIKLIRRLNLNDPLTKKSILPVGIGSLPVIARARALQDVVEQWSSSFPHSTQDYQGLNNDSRLYKMVCEMLY